VIFLAYKQGLSFEISESRVIEAFFLLIYKFAGNLVLPIKIKRLRGFRARVCCLGMNYFRRGKLLTKACTVGSEILLTCMAIWLLKMAAGIAIPQKEPKARWKFHIDVISAKSACG